MTRCSQSEKYDNQNLELQGQRHLLLTVWNVIHSWRTSSCKTTRSSIEHNFVVLLSF